MVPHPCMASSEGGQVDSLARAFGAALLVLAVGFISGWQLRSHTTGDQYITALASRMIAEASYFNQKTDLMIRDNERIYGNGKKKN